MELLSQVIQYAISGITSGSIYAIVGVCWSIVYLVSKIINFTTGEFVMLGGMLTWVYIGFGLGEAPAAVLAIASTVAVGIIVERLAIRPAKRPTEMGYMVITFAAASIISEVILLTAGPNPHAIKPFIAIESINILGAGLNPQVIVVVCTLIIVTGGLSLFLKRTILGKALVATAINQQGARFVGIKIGTLNMICFGLAGGLGAIAGLVITPITFTGYATGSMVGLKGLVAGLAGGWSIIGTVIAGLGLGLAEGFFAGFILPGWKDAFTLIIMIIFLIAKTIRFSPRKRKVRL